MLSCILTGFSDCVSSFVVSAVPVSFVDLDRRASEDVRCAVDFSRDYPIKLGNYISMRDFAHSPTPLTHHISRYRPQNRHTPDTRSVYSVCPMFVLSRFPPRDLIG